jgi:hypothetical protein
MIKKRINRKKKLMESGRGGLRKGSGRPKLKDQNKKTSVIKFRVREELREAYLNLGGSYFIRQVLEILSHPNFIKLGGLTWLDGYIRNYDSGERLGEEEQE